MLLSDVMKGIDYERVYGSEAEIQNLAIDSRAVRNGSLFFCLRGVKSDGHNFLTDVCGSGAAAAVVDKELELIPPPGVSIVRVSDCRKALAIAAANFNGRPADGLNLIGVTGTKGKTSSTFFIEAILREDNRRAGIIGTVETRVMDERLDIAFATSTTPDPIELQRILAVMQSRNASEVIMEVSSHALALDKLYGTRFGIGVFTNLSQDHLDFHKDMQSYLEAKAKLFKMCDIGIVNADSDACDFIKATADCRIVTYGIDRESDYRAKNVELLPDGVAFDTVIDGKTERFKAAIGGRFTVYNLLGALAAAHELGVPAETIKRALKGLKGVPGRLQSVPNNMDIRVIVDYAHSPDSLKNIITAVREFTRRRLITVFGCGGDRDRLKRPIMGQIAGELSDFCVLTSDNPRTEDPDAIIDDVVPGVRDAKCPFEREPDRRKAIARAIELAMPGDSVIIAGKGHEDYQIFADRTIRFDDYEVAEEILKNGY